MITFKKHIVFIRIYYVKHKINMILAGLMMYDDVISLMVSDCTFRKKQLPKEVMDLGSWFASCACLLANLVDRRFLISNYRFLIAHNPPATGRLARLRTGDGRGNSFIDLL